MVNLSKKPTIGVGIVTWKSPKTLKASLQTYIQADLFSHFDQSLIYFQDISPEDEALAKQHNLPYDGGPNIGIAEGMRRIAQLLDTDYVLFLENDCPLIEPQDEVKKQLDFARQLLATKKIDIMRLRHRKQPGQGFSFVKKYKKQHPVPYPHPTAEQKFANRIARLRRFLRPLKARKVMGAAVYIPEISAPETHHPGYIEKTGDGVYIIDSACINWTNQSVLCSREFFLNTLMPYVDANPSSNNLRRTCNGFQTPEVPLNSRWWRQQHFKIGVGLGLFTHQRLDDNWRH